MNVEPAPAVCSLFVGPLDPPAPTVAPSNHTHLPQQKQAVYNYPVLREALNVMSQAPAPDQQGKKGPPFLLMRTVMVSVTSFPELKNFIATVVLVRLVQQEVRFGLCVLGHSLIGSFVRLRRLIVSVCHIGAHADPQVLVANAACCAIDTLHVRIIQKNLLPYVSIPRQNVSSSRRHPAI